MNEILIYGDIGFEVHSREIVSQLKDANGPVTVRVNSYGGDIYEGISIMNALRSYPDQVTAIVEGVAASAASVIAVCGATRTEVCPGAEIMVHLPWMSAPGNSDDLRKAADDLERTALSMADLYAEKAGGGQKLWLDMMRDETWFSAQEAVDAGLADAVEDGRVRAEPVVAASGRGPRFAFAGRSHAPTPKILKEENNVTLMKKVAERLGMSGDGLTDEMVLAALDETLAEQANGDTEDTEEADTENVEDEQVEDTTVESEEPQEVETDADEADTDTAGEDEDGPDGEEAAAEDSGASEVVTLNKAVYEDLLERAGRVDEHDRAELAQRAATLIDNDGIKAGRLLGWQRDAWVERAVENYDGTRAELLSYSPGTVNVTERGVAGSAEDAGKQSKSQRRGRDAGLAPAPTV